MAHNTHNDDEEETQIEEYLLEYVRQIERYDKIRAAKELRAQQLKQQQELQQQQQQQKLIEQYKPKKVVIAAKRWTCRNIYTPTITIARAKA